MSPAFSVDERLDFGVENAHFVAERATSRLTICWPGLRAVEGFGCKIAAKKEIPFKFNCFAVATVSQRWAWFAFLDGGARGDHNRCALLPDGVHA